MPEHDFLHAVIGNDAETITWWQMSLRAVLIFLLGIALLRLGGRRIFSRITPFDIVLAVVVGSNLSRALTGNAPFLPTVAATLALILAHHAVSAAAWRWRGLGRLMKGDPVPLVRDGLIDWERMRRNSITTGDLEEAARTQGIPELGRVRAAYLERSGDISIIS